MAAADKSPHKQRRPSVFSDPHPAPNSLFGEILDWMLAPLLLVWPISIAVTHHVADQIADQVYDDVLAEHVVRFVQAVHVTPDGVSVTLPVESREPDAQEGNDRLYFQVAVAEGEIIQGADIPALRGGDEITPGKVHFRNGSLRGEPIRIAYQLLPTMSDARPLLIQVAETRKQRQALSSRIISGVLLPQFAIIPLAALLVWLGLTRGLRPISRLRERILEQRPDDLSPIDLQTVPEELQPIVAAFNDMMVHLKRNLESQQRFISAAAHQLKTPLTGLKTEIDLALREDDPQQLRGYLERLAAGIDHASRLTSQLLQLARVEAGQKDMMQRKEPVDIGALAREVTMDCAPRALVKNIDIGFEASGTPANVMGVPFLLREMIENLVDNAIKYTPMGGVVTVRVCSRNGWAVEVEDTGPGIDPAERERIFDRFYRLLGSSVDGSGLGLAIVQEIAQLHAARVSVEQGQRGGSRFLVVFSVD